MEQQTVKRPRWIVYIHPSPGWDHARFIVLNPQEPEEAGKDSCNFQTLLPTKKQGFLFSQMTEQQRLRNNENDKTEHQRKRSKDRDG
jgi:hypothetical protein